MAAPFLLTTSAGCAFAGLPSLRGHTSRGRALRRKTCTLPVNRAEERLFAKEVGDFPPPTPAWPARASGVQSCGSRPMGSTCGGHRLSLTLPRLVVLSTSQSMWLLDAAWSVGCRGSLRARWHARVEEATLRLLQNDFRATSVA